MHHFILVKRLKQFIEKQSDDWLTGLFLPTRSPFLNPVETKVNRNLKKDVCANYNYETEDNLLCTVRRYLRCMGSWPKDMILNLEPFDFTKYNSWKKIVDYNNRVISKVNSYFVNLHDKESCKSSFQNK